VAHFLWTTTVYIFAKLIIISIAMLIDCCVDVTVVFRCFFPVFFSAV